jgi:large-conductance mechanosensitive channel
MDINNNPQMYTFPITDNNAGMSQPPPPQSLAQIQQPQPQQPSTKKQTFIENIKAFLNTKTGTIITFAASMAIANAFKDLVTSIISSIVQPLFIKFVTATNLISYVNLQSLITSQNSALGISNMFSSLFSFIIILIIVYYLFYGIQSF